MKALQMEEKRLVTARRKMKFDYRARKVNVGRNNHTTGHLADRWPVTMWPAGKPVPAGCASSEFYFLQEMLSWDYRMETEIERILYPVSLNRFLTFPGNKLVQSLCSLKRNIQCQYKWFIFIIITYSWTWIRRFLELLKKVGEGGEV